MYTDAHQVHSPTRGPRPGASVLLIVVYTKTCMASRECFSSVVKALCRQYYTGRNYKKNYAIQKVRYNVACVDKEIMYIV